MQVSLKIVVNKNEIKILKEININTMKHKYTVITVLFLFICSDGVYFGKIFYP